MLRASIAVKAAAIQRTTFACSILLVWISLLTPFRANATLNWPAGSFENPSPSVRPPFRYWVPDASVNLSQIREDILDVARIGAGGVELLGYYNYGNIELGPLPIPTDWTKYGFGTPAWSE